MEDREEKRNRLEEKRKKLEELKRAREARNNISSSRGATTSSALPSSGLHTQQQQQIHQQQQKLDIDNLLTTLLRVDSPTQNGSPVHTPDILNTGSVMNEDQYSGESRGLSQEGYGSPVPSAEERMSEDDRERSHSGTPHMLAQNSLIQKKQYPPLHNVGSSQRFSNLSISQTTHHAIAIEEKITYDKGTQTDDDWVSEVVAERVGKILAEKDLEMKLHEDAENLRIAKRQAEAALQREQENELQNDTGFSDRWVDPTESVALVQTDGFSRFFERTSKLVERSLYEVYDIAVDYSAVNKTDSHGDTSDVQISATQTYATADISHITRAVTDLNWSPHTPELFVCAYSGASRMGSLIGTLYTGLIVVWDMSTSSGPIQRTPVQRSKLSKQSSSQNQGHTHPVYCQGWVGTQHANNLITVSNDGYFCVWNPDNINEPIENKSLKRDKKPLPVTTIAFTNGDSNNFVVGGEDGVLHVVPRHIDNDKMPERFEDEHFGPVLGLSHHPRVGDVDLSELILSCSADWTLRLWHKSLRKSILSFEDSSDYIYDVAWSPVHPTVFASIDGSSRLSLWNLRTSVEIPTKTVQVNADKAALNRVRWCATGNSLMVGDSMGRCHLFDLGESLYKPREGSSAWLRDMVRDLLSFESKD
eukprot:CFRG0892T1